MLNKVCDVTVVTVIIITAVTNFCVTLLQMECQSYTPDVKNAYISA